MYNIYYYRNTTLYSVTIFRLAMMPPYSYYFPTKLLKMNFNCRSPYGIGGLDQRIRINCFLKHRTGVSSTIFKERLLGSRRKSGFEKILRNLISCLEDWKLEKTDKTPKNPNSGLVYYLAIWFWFLYVNLLLSLLSNIIFTLIS